MYKNFLKIFIALILFYIISLTLVYSINPQILTYHTKSGLTLINKETNYPRYFFGNSYAVRLDNFTDKLKRFRFLKTFYIFSAENMI